jgi:hypothetical protein
MITSQPKESKIAIDLETSRLVLLSTAILSHVI